MGILKIIDIFVSKSSTSIIFGSKAVKKDIEKNIIAQKY